MTSDARTIEIAGVEVPRVGLGTNRLTPAPGDLAFLREAVEAGIRHIDTAHLYTGGESERAIGEALAPFGDDLLVATKAGYNGTGSPAELRDQAEQSLRSLRTDALALLYLHRVDPDVPLEESLGAIAEMRDEGKVRAVGLSAVSVDQIEAARRVVPVAAVQNEFNAGDRSSDPVIDHCEAEGIPFVPYFPLRGAGDPRDALRRLLDRSPVVAPIPGTLSIEHLRENLAVLDDLG